MGERKVNRYLTLLVLALGAVSIYLLPYYVGLITILWWKR